jgi:D-sedoheptulose 7-phosphate isomerase
VDPISRFLEQVREVAARIDRDSVAKVIDELVLARDRGGRVFVLGVGGSAANASHAVNDFRKLCAIEAYAPTDNVSELTARTNDEGWSSVFSEWLKTSRVGPDDLVLVFSVGGGDRERGISPNLVSALELARERGARIAGVVGRDGGFTARVAHACVVVPTVDPAAVTPLTEAFQAVVWHLIVSHPDLCRRAPKWESTP